MKTGSVFLLEMYERWIELIWLLWTKLESWGVKAASSGRTWWIRLKIDFYLILFQKWKLKLQLWAVSWGLVYIHVCASVPVSFAVFKRVGIRNVLCCVSRWHSCLHCKLNCCQSRYTQPRVGCICLSCEKDALHCLFCIINWNYWIWAALLSVFPLFGVVSIAIFIWGVYKLQRCWTTVQTVFEGATQILRPEEEIGL